MTSPANMERNSGNVAKRKIIVHIATSADGYIARPDGNLDWLTNRPAPKGFYGLPKFMRTVDAKILGRKTFDLSVKMGANFSANDVHYVFSRQPPPPSVPVGVRFVTQPIHAFAKQMRAQTGKNMWLMGGGELIASFLDEGAIDEFIISFIPMFIGEGIPVDSALSSAGATPLAVCATIPGRRCPTSLSVAANGWMRPRRPLKQRILSPRAAVSLAAFSRDRQPPHP
jgi:dihydrofolate reductase